MPAKKVLIVHVPYETPGGEEAYVKKLGEVYRDLGLQVEFYPPVGEKTKNTIFSAFKALLPGRSLPEFEIYYERFQPDFLHLNNIHPILGPRFLRWIKNNNIFSLMTIHNHRFFCTNGLALRQERICKACFSSRVMWRSIVYNCNQSMVKTVYHCMALSEIRYDALLEKAVKYFIAPSLYIKNELKNFGIQENKIKYIMHPPHVSPMGIETPEYDVVYAGRLSQEKGIQVLLESAKILPELKFLILGSGPEEERVRQTALQVKNITYVGQKSLHETLGYIAKAKVGVLTSICNEILSIFCIDVFYQGKYCVVSETDSTLWMKEQEMPVIFAKSGDAEDFSRAIRGALLLPALSDSQKEAIRKKLSPDYFKSHMKELVDCIPLAGEI